VCTHVIASSRFTKECVDLAVRLHSNSKRQSQSKLRAPCLPSGGSLLGRAVASQMPSQRLLLLFTAATAAPSVPLRRLLFHSESETHRWVSGRQAQSEIWSHLSHYVTQFRGDFGIY
jgi:hypothetical protein